jgi:hypothetical protein
MKNWQKFNENQTSSFKKEIYDIAMEYGGEERSDAPGYDMVLDTKYSLLFINVREDLGHSKDSVYAVFMRFAFPKDIKGKVDCNQNSGKWNIWESNYDDAIAKFKRRMEEVKGKSDNPFERLDDEMKGFMED